MEKLRIKDIGMLEIRLIDNRVQFSTTPDHQEVIAELSKYKALKIANKIFEWAGEAAHDNSGLNISCVMTSCETCKHEPECRHKKIRPEGKHTCRFYIEHDFERFV